MRDALFFRKIENGKVQCLLCPHLCTLSEGKAGKCGVRRNVNAHLHTEIYGKLSAIHFDPIEKKPLYHFLPSSRSFSIATAGCNLACLNCQNWNISQSSPTETRNYDLMPEAVVDQAVNNNCQTIAYTYSEPITFFEYTCDSARMAHEKGVRNVLVSAGYINPEPQQHLI